VSTLRSLIENCDSKGSLRIAYAARQRQIETDCMTEEFTGQEERRKSPRFSVKAPVTVLIGDLALPAYTRNVSERGVYFYVSPTESELIPQNFDFLLELPPEVTISNWCSIRCQGRLVRRDETSSGAPGIAAEILHYSILREAATKT